MARGRTMKKKRVGGGRPGLKINTGSYKIATSLGREEIAAMIAELQTIQGRGVEAYARVSDIASRLLATQGAITLEGDVSQVEHAKSFAEAASAANNVKRAKYDKAENVANIIVAVLERIGGSMVGGAGFLEGLKGMFFVNNNTKKNNALTSGVNVQAGELDLEIPEPQPNQSQQNPLTLPNLNVKTNNTPIVNGEMVNQKNGEMVIEQNNTMMNKQMNNTPIVNEEMVVEETNTNIQPMTGGKRRKSKTRKQKKQKKQKKTHKRR
jgi:hypothetical protein